MGRIIIIAVCIYLLYIWVLKPLLRYLLPILVKKAVEKQFGKFNNQNQRPKKPEGTIHVDYIPEKDKKRPQNKAEEGEYIDYEEVK
jgi:hypothetical protein